MASTFSSFGFIPFSSISCPSHLVCFRKNSDFLLLARYPAFSSLDRTSNSFFSCCCLFPRVTTMMSSSHAGVLYSNVRLIFFLEDCGDIGKSVKPFFESVISAKFCSGNCEYTLSACFFGKFHLSVCVV